MRIIVLLKPSNKHGAKTACANFRKHLASDGFTMIAPELYMRVISNREAIAKHRKRMEAHVPQTGQIAMLALTEKQWGNIAMLAGEHSYQEKRIGAKSCTMP